MPDIESYNVEKKYSDTNDKYVKSIIIPIDFVDDISIKGISYDAIIDGLTKNMIVFKDIANPEYLYYPLNLKEPTPGLRVIDIHYETDGSGYAHIQITKSVSDGSAVISVETAE